MSGLKLRLAREDDLPYLTPIDRAANERFAAAGLPELVHTPEFPLAVALRALARDGLWIAEWDGERVGWMYLTRSGGELCVGEVCVLPSHGQRGIGTALLRKAIAQARASGERSIVLNTQRDVAWNAPWYERHGFVVVPREQWTADMLAIEAEQRAMGMDWSQRAHLRLVLERGE